MPPPEPDAPQAEQPRRKPWVPSAAQLARALSRWLGLDPAGYLPVSTRLMLSFNKPPLRTNALPGPALRAPALLGPALLAIALLTGCVAQPGQAPVAPRIASFAPLVKMVLPAVVNIAVTEEIAGNDLLGQLPPEMRGTPLERQFQKRFRNRREQVTGAGSGFIVDPSGIIVTNDHVVGHAARIVVSLTDGREFPAKVLGVDELTDVAVIKVDAPAPLPFVTWGDSRRVEVGDWILAAGNPFGLGGSITAGIVAARGRDIGAMRGVRRGRMLQHARGRRPRGDRATAQGPAGRDQFEVAGRDPRSDK